MLVLRETLTFIISGFKMVEGWSIEIKWSNIIQSYFKTFFIVVFLPLCVYVCVAI